MKDGTDIITNVISHLASHRLFRCSYSNSRDVVASTPSFFRPAIRVPRNACSQAIVNWVTDLIFCVVDQQTLKQMGVWNPVEKMMTTVQQQAIELWGANKPYSGI